MAKNKRIRNYIQALFHQLMTIRTKKQKAQDTADRYRTDLLFYANYTHSLLNQSRTGKHYHQTQQNAKGTITHTAENVPLDQLNKRTDHTEWRSPGAKTRRTQLGR